MKILFTAIAAASLGACGASAKTVSVSLSSTPSKAEIDKAKAELCAHIDASFTPFQSVRRQEAECLANAEAAIKAKLNERVSEG